MTSTPDRAITRRTLLSLLVGVSALPIINRLPELAQEEVTLTPGEVASVTPLYGELTSVTRKAFVPRLFVQLYFGSPLDPAYYSGFDLEYPT